MAVNNLTLQEKEEGDHYKHLGLKKSVGIDGELNKRKAIKEYKTQIKRIWSSELNAANKITAHNTLATQATPSDFYTGLNRKSKTLTSRRGNYSQ